MPITVNFRGRPPKIQKINKAYVINYNPDDPDVELDKEYVDTFITNYTKAITTLRRQNILEIPDCTSAVYFGIELNNINNTEIINDTQINSYTINRIKEINEEEKNEEKNGTSGPCIDMIKYTRICDSAIIPCKFIINSTRQIDSQIDSQIVKNQLAAEKPLTVPPELIAQNPSSATQEFGEKPRTPAVIPTSENQSSAISQDQGFGEKPRTPAVVTPLKNQSFATQGFGEKPRTPAVVTPLKNQSSSKKKQENNTRKK